ncbi:MAG: cytochrome C [Armatimonadetes bacterium]|nr:cytochrome C [Armatimonadota bacterium]
MRFSRKIASMGVMALLAIGMLALSGCGGNDDDPEIVTGQSQNYFGGQVTTWAALSDEGTVEQVGFTLPLTSIQNASGHGPETMAVLNFPQQVSAQTFVNHLNIGWNEHGHPPQGVYTVPHFDIHFYNQTPAQVQAINCTDTTAPEANRIPQGYALPPPTAPGSCVPQMGFHASPGSDFAPGNTFTRTMVLGYYGGRLTFLEPMVTRQQLLQKQSFSLAIPAPQVVGISTRYPARLQAEWDEDEQAYHFILTDFVSVT